MPLRPVYAPEALADLERLYDFFADASLPSRALAYVEALQSFCAELATFPERDRRRDGLRPGLRVTSFRRRVTIAYHVTDTGLVIDRLLYAGRDADRLLQDD